jgi:hypothetical protein
LIFTEHLVAFNRHPEGYTINIFRWRRKTISFSVCFYFPGQQYKKMKFIEWETENIHRANSFIDKIIEGKDIEGIYNSFILNPLVRL